MRMACYCVGATMSILHFQSICVIKVLTDCEHYTVCRKVDFLDLQVTPGVFYLLDLKALTLLIMHKR